MIYLTQVYAADGTPTGYTARAHAAPVTGSGVDAKAALASLEAAVENLIRNYQDCVKEIKKIKL